MSRRRIRAYRKGNRPKSRFSRRPDSNTIPYLQPKIIRTGYYRDRGDGYDTAVVAIECDRKLENGKKKNSVRIKYIHVKHTRFAGNIPNRFGKVRTGFQMSLFSKGYKLQAISIHSNRLPYWEPNIFLFSSCLRWISREKSKLLNFYLSTRMNKKNHIYFIYLTNFP